MLYLFNDLTQNIIVIRKQTKNKLTYVIYPNEHWTFPVISSRVNVVPHEDESTHCIVVDPLLVMFPHL